MNQRIQEIYRPIKQRSRDFCEVERNLSFNELLSQAERCMHCGIPFCHGSGCPLGNIIPEINAAVAAGSWVQAWELLRSTSSFPEFTGRVCPALCEGSCVSGLDGEPVMVRQLEKAVVEHAFELGMVTPPYPRSAQNGKKIAVVGAGPAGLAAAVELNIRGYSVVVYEEKREIGGLLRYGIPDFKLEKSVIERRKRLLEEAGIRFECGTAIGKDISGAYLRRNHDAVVLTIGTPQPRDLPIPGRDFSGIHFALEFLCAQNRLISGESSSLSISAAGKRVVVIGGGDTGSDCVGTAIRQGAASVLQLEIMPRPPESRSPSTPWPEWPRLLRSSSSHKEGGERHWSVATKRFIGDNGGVSGIEIADVQWEFSDLGKPVKFTEKPGSERLISADLVLLALGFTGVRSGGIIEELGVAIDESGKVVSSPQDRVFAAGDCACGASLVVRAIADGRRVAEQIDKTIGCLQ